MFCTSCSAPWHGVSHGCEAHANIGPTPNLVALLQSVLRSNLTSSSTSMGATPWGKSSTGTSSCINSANHLEPDDDSFSTCLACERLLEASPALAAA